MSRKVLIVGGPPVSSPHPAAWMAKSIANTGTPVLYVSRWGSVVQDLRGGRWSSAYSRLTRSHLRLLEVPTPFLTVCTLTGLADILPLSGIFHVVQTEAVYNQVRQWVRDTPGELTLLLYWWFMPGLIELLGPKYVVFDLIDDHRAYLGGTLRLAREQEMRLVLSRSDAVFAVSSVLETYAKEYNDNVHFLPNGFLPPVGVRDEFDESGSVPGKVIGYWGGINMRIDYELLRDTLKLLPDYSLEMVGPTDYRYALVHERVKWLGPLPWSDLVGVMKRWSAALIPFRREAFTDALDPLKLREYFYTGLPVIATPLDGLSGLAKSWSVPERSLYFGSTAEEMSAAVLQACREDEWSLKKLRRQWSLRWTWEDRARAFLREIGTDGDGQLRPGGQTTVEV